MRDKVAAPSATKWPRITSAIPRLREGPGDDRDPAFHRRRAVPQRQPAFVRLEAGGPVLGVHRAQRALEYPPEIPDPVVVPAKLRLKHRPGDEGRLTGIDPVKPLRQPGVDIERCGVVRSISAVVRAPSAGGSAGSSGIRSCLSAGTVVGIGLPAPPLCGTVVVHASPVTVSMRTG
jgi:hypothetical protein